MSYNDALDRIKQNIDIVDYIGKKVTLKRAGANYKGLCPFHGEKTPSFVVSPEKQIFTCFGCGESGDILKFTMRSENLDYREAMEKLAAEAGVELSSGGRKANEKKEELYEVSRQAARHFYKSLRNGDNPGIRYVISRGITPETAVRFGIGYAADSWNDMRDFLEKMEVSSNAAYDAGLLQKNEKGYYDKFRNRVIFPIFNTRDKIIGFGGRAIEKDAMPKYLNSPETLIFKKKDNLYGLNLAKSAIREQNLAIVVEGYMDVVSLAQAGVENVVASLGTALTSEQARLLKRYTDTVVLCYDTDNAGRAATLRGIDILLEAGLKVKVLQVTGGKDPDEFIKQQGKAAFDELLDSAVSFMQYKIDVAREKSDISTTEGAIRFLEEISGELKKIKSPAEQAAYVKQVSTLTGIPESSIEREIQGAKPSRGRTIYSEASGQQDGENARMEAEAVIDEKKRPTVRTLIRLMVSSASYIPIIKGTDELSSYFQGSGYEGILSAIFDIYSPDGEIDETALYDRLDDRDVGLLKEIMQNILPSGDDRKTLFDCVARIKEENLTEKRANIIKILEVMDEEKDIEENNRLLAELMDINSAISQLKARKEQLNE